LLVLAIMNQTIKAYSKMHTMFSNTFHSHFWAKYARISGYL